MMAFVGLLPARPAGTRKLLRASFARPPTVAETCMSSTRSQTEPAGPARVELSHPFQALHERTGWWDTVWPRRGRPKTAGIARHAGLVELNPHSTATLEIRIEGTFREGTAMKGKLSALKIESDTAWRLRDIARRLGVPPRWQMLPEPRLRASRGGVSARTHPGSCAGSGRCARPGPKPDGGCEWRRPCPSRDFAGNRGDGTPWQHRFPERQFENGAGRSSTGRRPTGG